MLVALARSLPNLSRGAREGADLGAGSGEGAGGTGLGCRGAAQGGQLEIKMQNFLTKHRLAKR